MSTRDQALQLLDTLNEQELEALVVLFQSMIAQRRVRKTETEEMQKREAAFRDLLSLCRTIPDFDEEAVEDLP